MEPSACAAARTAATINQYPDKGRRRLNNILDRVPVHIDSVAPLMMELFWLRG